jgi:KaiC/GvpD/RAD55 family RecA-like ATPase
MPLTTGDPVFDALLGGGVPEGSTLLLRGGPGTGKSRLAAGFLRAGAHTRGADRLWVTTAGRASAPAHDDATVITVAAGEDGALALAGSDSNESVTPDEFAANVASRGPFERAVVDSATALARLVDPVAGQRALLDLLGRLEADGTTCVATAAGHVATRHGGPRNAARDGSVAHVPPGRPREATADALAVAADGVLALWQAAVDGDYHTFLRVQKLSGIAHDTREHRLAHTEGGARVVSRTRNRDAASPGLPTGVEGFDALAGGVARDRTTVFEYDGAAEHWPFTAALCARTVEHGGTVVLITALGTALGRANDLLAAQAVPVRELMERDSLYLIDTVTRGAETLDPAVSLPEANHLVQAVEGGIQESIRTLVGRLAGQPTLAVLELSPLLHLVTAEEVRQLFYWADANVLSVDGISLVLAVNRRLVGDALASFCVESAAKGFRTWQGPAGLTYVSVSKAPTGDTGRVRVVEPVDDPPYVRVG